MAILPKLHLHTRFLQVDISYMPYFINMNIYLMALWGHGIMNPTISNLMKRVSHRPFPIPKIHEHTLKEELDQLIKVGVSKWINASKWATPTFIISKKDATVRFISDFHEVNRCIKHKPSQFQRFKTCYWSWKGFSMQHPLISIWAIII